jgi:hypothetical protein
LSEFAKIDEAPEFSNDLPSTIRVIVAFLLAALIPTFFYSSLIAFDSLLNWRVPFPSTALEYYGYISRFFHLTLRWMRIGLVLGGVVPALIVGIIIYLWLRKKFRLSLFKGMIFGGLAANTQTLLFEIFGPRNESFQYTIGQKQIIKDGYRTFDGWINFAQGCFYTFLLGALGGIVFWLIVRRKGDYWSRF